MKKMFLTLFIGLISTAVHSQDVNNELLNTLIEKKLITQVEADSILLRTERKQQSKKSITEAADKVKNAFNTPYMQLGGYSLFTHTYNSGNEIKNKTNVRGAYLSIKGEVVKNLKYLIFTDFSNKPDLIEFYIDWTPYKELNFRAGQQNTPFTLENPMSLTDLEFIYNTRTIASLVGMGSDVLFLQNNKNNTGRDMGIQASGNLAQLNGNSLIQYNIGIFQGTGMTTNALRNNRDFVSTLMIQPVKGFRIGGGLYLGEAKYSIAEEEKAIHVRNRWVLSTEYRTDNFYTRLEWLKGKDSKTDKEGLYGLASWFFVPKKWNLLAKVDYFNRDKHINSEVIDYSTGLSYYIYKKNRIQLNYTYSDYSNVWGTKNSHEVVAQLQIVY